MERKCELRIMNAEKLIFKYKRHRQNVNIKNAENRCQHMKFGGNTSIQTIAWANRTEQNREPGNKFMPRDKSLTSNNNIENT